MNLTERRWVGPHTKKGGRTSPQRSRPNDVEILRRGDWLTRGRKRVGEKCEIRDRRSELPSGRAAQQVPDHLGLLSCVTVFSVLWLLVTWWAGTMSWNLVPRRQFLALGVEDEISQLVAA